MSSIELVLIDYFKQAKDEMPRVTPLYFLVYSAIHKAILEGDLEPGEGMPSQKKLVKLFNVSITTVIRALRLLADEDLVSSRSGKGVYVRLDSISAV